MSVIIVMMLRFRLRTVFYLTFAVAVCLFLFVSIRSKITRYYYWQLEATKKVFSEYPEIEIVRIIGTPDIFYEVEVVELRIKGRQDNTISVVIPDAADYSEIRDVIEKTIHSE